jgi:hypothetical protein
LLKYLNFVFKIGGYVLTNMGKQLTGGFNFINNYVVHQKIEICVIQMNVRMLKRYL